jgi:hypothetical protein
MDCRFWLNREKHKIRRSAASGASHAQIAQDEIDVVFWSAWCTLACSNSLKPYGNP